MLFGGVNQGDNFCKGYSQEKCKVVLQNKDLWTKFHQHETEMIITKSGRRMFPALRVQAYDLDPNAHYCVLLEFSSASSCRYKYSAAGGWTAAGAEEAHSPHRIYLHPESPATGEHWMAQPISFGRLKLTNTPNPPPGHIVLSSMHKYQPRVIIIQTMDPRTVGWASSVTTAFPETEFIAVTAYQNEKITKLKIDNNPFAKGFRENGQSKCKRKRPNLDEVEEPSSKAHKEDEHSRALLNSRVSPSCLDSSEESTSYLSSSPSSPELITDRVPSISPRLYQPYNHFRRNSMFYFGDNMQNSHQFGCDYYYPAYVNSFPSLYPTLFSPYVAYPQQMIQNGNNLDKFEPLPRKFTDFSIKAITGLP